jgi:chemotaxis protein MotB
MTTLSSPSAGTAPDDGQLDAQKKRSSGRRLRTWNAGPVVAEEQEGWLITYLDVITLLLVMMVVMLAFAGPIGAKGPGSTDQPASLSIPSIRPTLPLQQPRASRDALAGLPVDALGKQVEVIVNQDKVSFRISSELLFASGEANLVSGASAVLDQLLPLFDKVPDHTVVVEGHTDNVPIQTERYPSNWELSTSRAGAVVRYLVSRGVEPQRLRATGYADTRPLTANDSQNGRAANRRVELVLEAPALAPAGQPD